MHLNIDICKRLGCQICITIYICSSSGTVPGEHAFRVTNRVIELRAELKDLEQKESMLDQQKFWVEQSTTSTKEDCSEYPFYKDVAAIEFVTNT